MAIPYFGIKGWLEIRQKDITSHMFASCFFFFGIERLVMTLSGLVHQGVIGEYMPLGPYKDWTVEDYENNFNIIAMITVPITFITAMYVAYIVPYNTLRKANEAATKTK